LTNVNVNVNVNVNLYSALSHSASNALGAPNTAETDASSVPQATEAGDAELWIAQIVTERVLDRRTNHD